jgi:AbrB family looped-hinge helix DNA binding protein
LFVIFEKHVMLQFKVSEGGRVVIPAELREKYGIEVGDTVVWRDSADGLMLSSRQAAIRRIQAIAAKYKKPGDPSIVDELIRERREEAARE